MSDVQITLSYEGADAASHQLDFYDAAIGLLGFQRSLAIVTHLVINAEIITQAPSLKGARILASPPQAGSWELPAVISIVLAAGYKIGTAPKESPIGHLVRSAYDYVVASTLGFHVDYDKSLGQQYDGLNPKTQHIPHLRPAQFESAVEKCEVAIKDMHRPIVFSETAELAQLSSIVDGRQSRFPYQLSRTTYEGMMEGVIGEQPFRFSGRVSSYNVNTFKGRVYLGKTERPISFDILTEARTPSTITAIARSLAANASSRRTALDTVEIIAIPIESRTGRLKGLRIVSAAPIAT